MRSLLTPLGPVVQILIKLTLDLRKFELLFIYRSRRIFHQIKV